MSTKAKLTLLTSIAVTSTIIYQVHYGQLQERNLMREGPRRDEAKERQKKLNALELEMQQRLQKEMEKDQSTKVTG